MDNIAKTDQSSGLRGSFPALPQTSRWRGKDVTVLSSALLGGAMGGVIGSMFGPLGTVAGAVVGVALGLILGVAIGSLISVGIDKFRVQSEKREQVEIDTPNPQKADDLPEWALVPVMKVWKAAQILNDLTIPELQKELSIDDVALIRDVYEYCLDSKLKEHLPIEPVSSIIAWVSEQDGFYQQQVNLKREKYPRNWNPSERLQFARETIENHPRFRYYPQEVKDTLIQRLFKSAQYSKSWEDLKGNWLLKDITVSFPSIQKVPSEQMAEQIIEQLLSDAVKRKDLIVTPYQNDILAIRTAVAKFSDPEERIIETESLIEECKKDNIKLYQAEEIRDARRGKIAKANQELEGEDLGRSKQKKVSFSDNDAIQILQNAKNEHRHLTPKELNVIRNERNIYLKDSEDLRVAWTNYQVAADDAFFKEFGM